MLVGACAPLETDLAQDGTAGDGRFPLAAPASPAPVAPPERVGTAQPAVDAAERAAAPETELGVAVLDRVTGEVSLGSRGDEPFYTASLAKLVVAVDVLDRRRLENLAVSDADVELMQRALGPSDDGSMNTLWTKFDGPGAAERVSSRLGLAATTAPADPSQWGQTSSAASDVVQLYDHVLSRMPDGDRDFFVAALTSAPAIAAGGFDQGFGLLSPELREPAVAAKQGWMCCFTGQRYLHTTGVVDAHQRYVVALLGRVPRGTGWDPARAEITAVATEATKALD